MSNDRPRLDLELSRYDRLIEVLSFMALGIMWIMMIRYYALLPDVIPVHFDAAGEADRMGSKASIWGLSIVATILFVGLTVLNRYPHHFNYLSKITEENALDQYTKATRMIRNLKLSLILIFGYLQWSSIQVALGEKDGLGMWFLPITMFLLFAPLLAYLVGSFSKK
jgi:uncharacterized membrane protein